MHGEGIRMSKLGQLGRWPFVAVAVALLSACGLQPGPTPLDVPANQVWIEWENHTDEAYAITVLAQGAESPAYGEVEPCTAHGMGLNLDGPFSIGIRDWDDDPSRPGREVADERTWREADGRLLLVIDEGGRVTPDTWTEQQASVAGFCP
jgi:hypothetical protein